jgi:hypothetical protein
MGNDIDGVQGRDIRARREIGKVEYQVRVDYGKVYVIGE